MVILVDDEDRENEGDLIMPASLVTPEAINFMITHCRGLICMPMTVDRCIQLGLKQMVSDNLEVDLIARYLERLLEARES